MSSEEFEKRINSKIETLLESQARNDTEITKILEAVAGMIQVARVHDEQIDRNTERIDRIEKQTEESNRQIKANSEQIAALAEQGKEQQERINALIRIVEQHVSNHP